jgi:DNA-binding transcriptional ArsR family regulator
MKKRPATREEARALSHPLRLRILRLCLYEARTNKKLAQDLDADPSSTLYHVRTLVKAGFLAAEEERRGKRGAREIPYRATGKSWTLDVGSDVSVNAAALDAYRAELLEAGGNAVLTSTRLGVRLAPEKLARLRQQLHEIGLQYADADDPDGVAVSLFIGLHRRDSMASPGDPPDKE